MNPIRYGNMLGEPNLYVTINPNHIMAVLPRGEGGLERKQPETRDRRERGRGDPLKFLVLGFPSLP